MAMTTMVSEDMNTAMQGRVFTSLNQGQLSRQYVTRSSVFTFPYLRRSLWFFVPASHLHFFSIYFSRFHWFLIYESQQIPLISCLLIPASLILPHSTPKDPLDSTKSVPTDPLDFSSLNPSRSPWLYINQSQQILLIKHQLVPWQIPLMSRQSVPVDPLDYSSFNPSRSPWLPFIQTQEIFLITHHSIPADPLEFSSLNPSRSPWLLVIQSQQIPLITRHSIPENPLDSLDVVFFYILFLFYR